MNLSELQQSIKNRKISRMYIFFGDEIGLSDIYIDKICEFSKREKICVDSAIEAFDQLNSISFSKVKKLFLVRNDRDFLSDDKFWKKFTDKIQNDVVIFTYNDIDKRSKFYKYFKNSLTEFEKLNENQLLLCITKKINLSHNNAKQLISNCDSTYSRIMFEIDKIDCLCSKNSCKPDMAFQMAVQDKLFFEEPQKSVFQFIDHVLRREELEAYNLLRDLKALKTSEILLISLLYTSFRNVLLVQGCDRATSEKTGLTGWQIQQVKEKTGYYKIQSLIENLKFLAICDEQIKNGKLDVEDCIDFILINLFIKE